MPGEFQNEFSLPFAPMGLIYQFLHVHDLYSCLMVGVLGIVAIIASTLDARASGFNRKHAGGVWSRTLSFALFLICAWVPAEIAYGFSLFDYNRRVWQSLLLG